jgi:hypothetical protein
LKLFEIEHPEDPGALRLFEIQSIGVAHQLSAKLFAQLGRGCSPHLEHRACKVFQLSCCEGKRIHDSPKLPVTFATFLEGRLPTYHVLSDGLEDLLL